MPRLLLTYALALALNHSPASAIPVHLFARDWIDDAVRPRPGGGSLQDEIQCYALPYGGLGLLSHFLTFYTAICLTFGRKPLAPWRKLKHGVTDTTICLVSLVFSVMSAAFSVSSCSNNWPFALLAFWMLTLSFSINAIGALSPWIHGARLQKEEFKPIYTLAGSALFWIGSVCGMVGIFYIVNRALANNSTVTILTVMLVGFAGTGLLACVLMSRCTLAVIPYTGVMFGVIITASVFYSDWVLASINNNWSGTPADSVALVYWCYFIAKRLPMLSW